MKKPLSNFRGPRHHFSDFFAQNRHAEPLIASPSSFRRSQKLRVKGLSKTGLTDGIRHFAAGFPNTPEGITAMVDAISRFKLVPSKFARLAYGKRTADDIIATGMIPTVGRRLIRRRDYDADIGCVDMCDALIAALKAKEIPATFCYSFLGLQEFFKLGRRHILEKILGHNEPHSYVLFPFQRKQYLADPFTATASRRIVALNTDTINRINLLEATGKLRKGTDSWDKKIGLYSFKNYTKERKRLGK